MNPLKIIINVLLTCLEYSEFLDVCVCVCVCVCEGAVEGVGVDEEK